MHDPYEDQLAAARYRAERDQARQELARLKDRSRDTTVSAYDLLPVEDREALRWVRGHGGLDEVRRDYQDAYNRRSELCAALGIDLDTGWSDAMAELDRRLMPEGMEWDGSVLRILTAENVDYDGETLFVLIGGRVFNGMNGLEILKNWPRFEDGARVKFGDVVSDGDETGRVYYVTFDTVNPVIIGFTDEAPDQDPGTWLEVSVNDGGRVKRPAPKVLDPKEERGE